MRVLITWTSRRSDFAWCFSGRLNWKFEVITPVSLLPCSDASKLWIGVRTIFLFFKLSDWLIPPVSYEDQVFHRLNALTQQLTRPEGYQLTRCPFQITWLVNQLARYLFVISIFFVIKEGSSPAAWRYGIMIQIWMKLWGLENSFSMWQTLWMSYGPVQVCRGMRFWSLVWTLMFPVIHNKCASLRQQLSEACSSKRLDVPVPEGFALPHVLRVMRG